MLLSDIYIAIGSYVKWAVDDSAVTISQAYQSSNTRPVKPFIIMSISGFTTEGSPMDLDIDEFGTQRTGLNKKFSLTLRSFSDDLHQSEELLNLAKDKIHTHASRSLFFKGDIVPRNILSGVNSMPQAESAINESEAILEIEFAMTGIITDEVGIIETIIVENKMNNEQIIVTK